MPLISSHHCIDKLTDLPLTGRTVSPNGSFHRGFWLPWGVLWGMWCPGRVENRDGRWMVFFNCSIRVCLWQLPMYNLSHNKLHQSYCSFLNKCNFVTTCFNGYILFYCYFSPFIARFLSKMCQKLFECLISIFLLSAETSWDKLGQKAGEVPGPALWSICFPGVVFRV